MVVSEKSFAREMEETMLPYLRARGGMRYLEREPGRKIFLLTYRADAPKGVLVISHGYTEVSVKYQETFYYLVKSGYTVYFPEHCGHGRSYRLTKDPSLVHIDRWERYTQDLACTADLAARENPGQPLYLFGHSMGGGIAAALAAKEPERFDKVVLCSPMIRPRTGKVPWGTAVRIARGFCAVGQSRRYVAGQRPYGGPDDYRTGNCLSPARFAYWQEKKEPEPLFHLSAASYGWLYQSWRLNRYLQHVAWRKIQAPVLMFQAGREQMVSKREQERFARKLAWRRKVRLIRVPAAKHEIFCGDARTMEVFWRRVFRFLESR